MQKTNTVRVYACGGSATNILGDMYQEFKKGDSQPGFAKVGVAFVDTSHSNMPRGAEEDFFFVEPIVEPGQRKREGSGKDRGRNIQAAVQAAPRILQKHKPGDLNIIIHSTSGGSGSAIGPVLLDELYKTDDHDVVVIVVGSTTSKREMYNTIRTLQGYQNAVKTHERSVHLIYFENSKETNMSFNDTAARLRILQLLAFWSGENHGLDDADLDNFLNFSKVSEYPPALTALQFFVGQDVVVDDKFPVPAILTMTAKEIDPNPGMTVGYHSYGEIKDEARRFFDCDLPIHLAVVSGWFKPVVDRIQILHDSTADPRVAVVEELDTTKGKTVGGGSFLL